MKIKSIDLERFRRAPDSILVLRLVMALNDLASGEAFLARILPDLPPTIRLKEVAPDGPKHDRLHLPALQGYLRYIIRMRIGHLAEAKRIVDEIEASTGLRNTLAFFNGRHGALWSEMLDAFADDRFNSHVNRVRHNLGFHYNHANGGRLLQKALDRRIDLAGRTHAAIVLSRDQDYMRIQLGDDVFDSAYGELLGVPAGDNFHERLHEEMGYSHDLVVKFGAWAWPFIDFYCAHHRLYQ